LPILLASAGAAVAGSVALQASVMPLGPKVRILGEADPATILHFQLALPMRHLADLNARNIRHQQVTAMELDRTYLPDQAGYAAVVAWLTANGLAVGRDENRLTIDVAGSVAVVSRVFQVHFSKTLSGGRLYTEADGIPAIPAELASSILSINGLQPHLHFHKTIIRMAAPGAPPYLPADINAAYSATKLASTGARSITAIIIDTLPERSDLASFWSITGVKQKQANITFSQTHDGETGPPTGEETLDTEMASAIAPGGKVRVYGSSDLAYVDSSFGRLIRDMKAGVHVTQVSMSFGSEESEMTAGELKTDSQFFATITSLGAAIFASSGDEGAFGNDHDPKTRTSLFPASDLNVTGVGATTLTFNGSAFAETGWSCQGSMGSCGNDDDSSGGGISRFFATPSYQCRNTSGQCTVPLEPRRATPDISVVGDPNTGVLIVFKGKEEEDGGTSVSTPIMAGYTGLINDTRLAIGKSTVGLLNPRIYPKRGTASITDITSGYNGYTAGAGYDLVTGIGTPVMSKLLPALASQP
jgi:kumamolisin